MCLCALIPSSGRKVNSYRVEFSLCSCFTFPIFKKASSLVCVCVVGSKLVRFFFLHYYSNLKIWAQTPAA